MLNSLHTLHLSANLLGCFKELLALTSLSSLKHLVLSDPHFGTNPVCGLCNYQTYSLYHLGNLVSLDNMTICSSQKTLAQSIYMKKKMVGRVRVVRFGVA